MLRPNLRYLTLCVFLFAAAGFAQEAEKPAETAETYSNTLRWSTASEEENFGFDVYRGDAEEGPFERLNEEPILGSGTTDAESAYQFVDDTIDPYAVYWYYVESISLSGERERFTPVFASKPKLTREEDENSDENSGDDGE